MEDIIFQKCLLDCQPVRRQRPGWWPVKSLLDQYNHEAEISSFIGLNLWPGGGGGGGGEGGGGGGGGEEEEEEEEEEE